MIRVGYIEPKIFADTRGFFRESLNVSTEPFNSELFVQQNVSYNKDNVFRGMHYQYDNPQGKLVTVLNGSVIDYIVDLRKWSPNFGIVMAFNLSRDNQRSLWVPPMFAHGFLSLEEDTIFMYNVFENPRVVGDEYSINPKSLGISLPEDAIVSEKDLLGLDFKDARVYD